MEKRRRSKSQNREKASNRVSGSGFNFLGIPDDRGIQNVQGRLGAKEGPAVFWQSFQKLKGPLDVHAKLAEMDVLSLGDDLEQNYQKAIDAVRSLRERFPRHKMLVVGGGHDTAYPWIRAWAESQTKKSKRIGCMNLDAHFDLRPYQPVMTSGSPFRRLIEEGHLKPKNLIEFGIQSHCNARELWDWAQAQGVRVVPFQSLRHGKSVPQFKKHLGLLAKNCDEILVSVDLDSVSSAFAPGVSAPQPEGFLAGELYEMMEIAGTVKKVTSVGFFELSPPLDVQNLTSRLASQAAWHYLECALR